MNAELKNKNTGFTIKALGEISEDENSWLNIELSSSCAGETAIYQSSVDKISGKFLFALKPHNELNKFIEQLESFLEDDSKQKLFFEPAEPSFEIQIKRSRHSKTEFQVYLWVDADNSRFYHYSWDARGIRFICNQNDLANFINSLKGITTSLRSSC